MKLFLPALIFLAMIVTSCRGARNDQPTVKSVATEAELVGDIENSIDRLVRADQFSGVVLLSREGKPLLKRAYGLANRESQRANTPETMFALGSVSKMFTAVLMAQLIEQRRVSVDATIGSLLPDFPEGPAKSAVTVHQLLTMSSGIPDVWRLPLFWEKLPRARVLSDLWPVFATSPLEFTPGMRWAYSNSNFLVLGAVIEQQFKEPFTATMEHWVFRSAEMKQTTYREPDPNMETLGYTHMRPGSQPDAKPDPAHWYPAWTEAEDESVPVVVPMGGGFSTADDLARFADALMHFQLLSAETTRQVLKGYVLREDGGSDGYGIETRLMNGVRIAGHQGGMPGVANQVDFYPDLGYVLVVLGNTDASGTEEIAKRVRAMIANSPALAQRR
jgi:CubicO group peptidase (beta-lactamase class C family)